MHQHTRTHSCDFSFPPTQDISNINALILKGTLSGLHLLDCAIKFSVSFLSAFSQLIVLNNIIFSRPAQQEKCILVIIKLFFFSFFLKTFSGGA